VPRSISEKLAKWPSSQEAVTSKDVLIV